MVENISGVILRETPIGESDKMMTVLTAKYGRISVYARGAKRLKSPLFSAAQLFSYSEMTVSKTNSAYNLRTADLIESFYHIRDTLEGAALAGYIADVAADIAVEGADETALTRLVLNCFHAIATGKKPLDQIKAVFELRAAAEAGFMPNLVACEDCGESELETYYFDIASGIFRCERCFREASKHLEYLATLQNENESIYPSGQLIALLSPSVFVAMRYALYAKIERIFAFELKDEALSDFASVCEKYLLCHLERNFATLDFYKTVQTPTKKKKESP